jgi:hypothetical protein
VEWAAGVSLAAFVVDEGSARSRDHIGKNIHDINPSREFGPKSNSDMLCKIAPDHGIEFSSRRSALAGTTSG